MSRRSKGEGTLLELPDGRWRARITIDGKTVTRDRTSRQAAVDALNDLKEHATLGSIPKDWTVEKWVSHWIEHIDDHDATTKQGYRLLMTPAVFPAIGKLRLDRLKPEHVEALYKSMRDGTHRPPKRRKNGTVEVVKPLAESSMLKTHRVLHRALAVAQQRQQLLRNPLDYVTPPKTVKPKTTALSHADAARVLKQAISDGDGLRWALSLMLGVRPAEALGLSWDCFTGDQVEIRQQLVQLVGQPVTIKPMTKTEEGLRVLDLPEVVQELAAVQRQRQLEWMVEAGETWKTWIPPGTDEPKLMVFTYRDGLPVKQRRDWFYWARLLERAGVPYQRPYAGRHTSASLMIANGVDAATVAAQLGHTDASFTMRTYVHGQREKQREASKLMGDLLG